MSRLKDFFRSAPLDDGDAVTGHYFECASDDKTRPQVWAYTAALCYAPGQALIVHAMSSAPTAQLTITRDALLPQTVFQATIATRFAQTPLDCSVAGCGWPKVAEMPIPDAWQSGVYIVTVTVPGHQSKTMFVVKARQPRAKILMLLATGTWCAYNDWGGSNHYQGITGPMQSDFAPDVSLLRPWAKGFVAWPADAPRIPHASPLLTRPRYPHMEYARAKGVSKKYASSGWAAFERPFALWCEAQGIALDYTTQHDLHRDPDALQGYDRVLIVGHDEYWSWEMRDHLESWIDAGGRLARFAGNFFWQTRLSDDLLTQTCYKTTAEDADPLAHTNRLTSYWDNPAVGRPAVATMGLTGSAGVYAGWSRCAAHGSGGYAVYRPDHWAMKDTGLGYGDVLGAASKIFAYEVDGIDHTFAHGLPFAVPGTGLQGDLTIIGLSPATAVSYSTGRHDRDSFIGVGDAEDLALRLYGGITADSVAKASRGNGCMAEYRRGKGAVFNAASCEWVAGLVARDRAVEQVTRNVLLGQWQ